MLTGVDLIRIIINQSVNMSVKEAQLPTMHDNQSFITNHHVIHNHRVIHG